jgi:hypothetical protein
VRRARNRRGVHVRLQPPHQLILVALGAGSIGKLIAIRAATSPPRCVDAARVSGRCGGHLRFRPQSERGVHLGVRVISESRSRLMLIKPTMCSCSQRRPRALQPCRYRHWSRVSSPDSYKAIRFFHSDWLASRKARVIASTTCGKRFTHSSQHSTGGFTGTLAVPSLRSRLRRDRPFLLLGRVAVVAGASVLHRGVRVALRRRARDRLGS